MVREIIAYKDYYRDFMEKLSDKERMKIRRALLLFSDTERIPSHFIKYIDDDIYEFRINYGHIHFSVSALWYHRPDKAFTSRVGALVLWNYGQSYEPKIWQTSTEIWHCPVNYGNNEFRIFFIYDGDKLVILFNAFRKKTQKTPRSEIAKAKRLKKEYYEDKNADI